MPFFQLVSYFFQLIYIKLTLNINRPNQPIYIFILNLYIFLKNISKARFSRFTGPGPKPDTRTYFKGFQNPSFAFSYHLVQQLLLYFDNFENRAYPSTRL